MRTFREKENDCEMLFENTGQYWHAYTDGKSTPVLFETEDDYRFAMNVIAQAAYAHREFLSLLAFEVMSNHFHFAPIAKEKELIADFFAYIQKRMSKTIPAIKKIKLDIIPIENLKSLRNTIVYINRNGYVADPRYTPFSYPWGTGRYYYNEFPFGGTYGEFPYKSKRSAFRGRIPDLPEQWNIIDGYIAPPSYCDIACGTMMFRDAQHYFYQISKNVEAYSEIASGIDDREYLTDSELFDRVCVVLQDEYGLSSIRDMSNAQKIDLAKFLRKNYRSSNSQISRVLHIPQYEVNTIFPLTITKK